MKVLALGKPEVEAEESHAEEIAIEASLKNNVILVSSPEGIEQLLSRGYGVTEEGKLRLTFYEALFLLGKKAMEVEDEEQRREDRGGDPENG